MGMQSKVESSLAGFNAATSISGSGTSGQIAYFNGANSITSNSGMTYDGTNAVFTGFVRANSGFGINADPSSTNIANFVKNQNASTRMVLSNTTAGGSNDVRYVMSSATDNLIFVADTAGTILSGASFSELGINQAGNKPINFRTNSAINMAILGTGVVTIGVTGGSVTHKINGDSLQVIGSTSTTNFDINRGAGTASISISGDSGIGNGGEIQVFGGTHATAPAEIRLKQNGTVVFKVGSSLALTLGSGTSTEHILNTLLGTNGAGALTLLNGPSGTTGNATGYISITINGSTRYIPFW